VYTIRVTGADWWERRVYYLSSGGIEREGTSPALKKLDKKFRETLTELFKPGAGGPQVTYRHGDKGAYLRGLHSVVTPDTLQIIESNPTGGKQIREGGKVGSWHDLVFWAERKLGLSIEMYQAQEFADAMVKRGYVGGKNSPIQSEYPEGGSTFKFPEWIVKYKNARDIDDCSRTMETMIVRYLS